MTHPVLAQLLAIALVVALVALAIVVVPVNRRGAPVNARPNRREDPGWHGFIYANSENPHLIVPKRIGPGWTLNFGHRRVWQTLFGVLAFVAVSIVVGTLSGANGRP